ncbi:uncharacterized protein LOC129600250 [Paramacrobiotus metropolitanus]|uniref:uncharacterized protein LOC129600250 n=1 Tax=Paramacrobiotus metropolitanus TaxID=2943436 RepID=UPI002445BCBB|nr:uncharacterized protein LOC129600250 [Paramacrobiotus metropolitanus]
MLVYQDDVCAWNAVDVLVDGQLQHGHVLNVIDGGLVVDFGCSSQFIPYGNIFECLRATDHPYLKYRPPWRWHAGDAAQVLLRVAPDAAWIWYPGTIVALEDYCQDDSVLVEVQLPGGTVREVLFCQQVRVPLSEEDLAQRRIGEKHFVIRCCPLPDGYWSAGSPLFAKIFQHNLHAKHDVLCKTVLSRELLYLQCRTGSPLDADALHEVFTASKSTLDTIHPPPLADHQMTTPHRPNKKRKTGVIRRLRTLHVELVVQVFQSLDSIGRIRCRRVCSFWNHLLTTDDYFLDVRVSGRAADLPDGPQHEEMHWVVSCLLKCVTSRTRTVVISHLESFRCLRCTVLIGHIRQAVRLPALIFYQCEFGGDVDPDITLATDIKDMLELWASCDRVVWKQCRIGDGAVLAVIALYALNAQPEAELETQLWELVERNLILKKPPALPNLAERIVDCLLKKPRKQVKTEIIRVLLNYQSADPRLSNPFRNRKWQLSDVARLDVQQLNRVTTVALSDGMDPQS